MLVGQAPGKVEAAGGQPFSGRAGRTLFSWFASVGLDEDTIRERLYIAAVTRCFPGPSPSGRGDRVPAPAERGQCGGWLSDELRIIRPRVIVPVGRLAMEEFLDPRPLNELVGRAHAVSASSRRAAEAGDAIVVPLPHPSGASSWIHAPGHRELVNHALRLFRAEWDRAYARRSAA
jgi:uracil-DNA glycosylase